MTSSPPWKDGDSIDSQLWFLFLSPRGFSQLPFNLMVNWSYVRSIDILDITVKYRKSCGKNIARCIDIPVVMRLALGAIPFTDIQRQRFNNVTTMSTALTTWEPSVNPDQRASIPFAFVIELANQLTPSSIRNSRRQLVVLLTKFYGRQSLPVNFALHHVFNRQILNNDGLVFKAPVGLSVYGESLSGCRQSFREHGQL